MSAEAGESTYGVLRIGEAQVALPISRLREVVPCPSHFAKLPTRAAGLLGAINVRGKVLPVFDLRETLEQSLSLSETQVVALLYQEGKALGLVADSLAGLTIVEDEQINRMAAHSGELLFSGSFVRHEDHSIVSVLSIQALMSQPGIPLLNDAQVANMLEPKVAIGQTRALMLLRCGEVGIAMDVTDIHTILPIVSVTPSSLNSAVCRGVITHAGKEIPAVDPLALMSLGQTPPEASCQALVINYEGGLVALLVNQVIEIAHARPEELLPIPALTVKRRDMLSHTLTLPDRGQFLVLADNALANDAQLTVLASLNTELAKQPTQGLSLTTSGASTVDRSVNYSVITFDLGSEVAAKLDHVVEVMKLPEHFAELPGMHAAVKGLVSLRGRSIALVDLGEALNLQAAHDDDASRVLVVKHEDMHFGFIVRQLHHVENATWEEPAREATKAAKSPNPLNRHAIVELGVGESQRTLPLVDLKKLAATLAGTQASCAA